jgi:DNA adenine methylase
VLRWAGGKRWLIPKVEQILSGLTPVEYREPFLGGGSVFLAFDWPKPTISDVNEDLVSTYRALADDPESVRRRLARLQVSKATFCRVRDAHPTNDIDRAVRLLYLNRCAYGGIYRTNKEGRFNVPFSGDRDLGPLLRRDVLARIGEAVSRASLTACDFEQSLTSVQSGAVVYCDPAYALPGAEAHFRRYSPTAFTWVDQCRLAEAAHELKRHEVCVLVSNSSDPRVARLFRGALTLEFVRRPAFSKSNGNSLREALYVLADRNTVRRLRRRLALD